MSETALVTGAAGFTGSHLLSRLVDEGWDVVGTDISAAERGQYYTETDNAPHPRHDASTARERSHTFVQADITEPETLDPLFEEYDIDTVFHVASLFDYFAERETLDAVNVDGARNVATRAADAGVDQFVHFSTLGVLGDAGFDEPNAEDAPYDPHNRYCASKRRQEEAVQTVARDQDMPLTILRPAPIYGPGNRYGVYHIPLVLSKLGIAPIWRIYPRSKQLRFPSVHVTDLCRIALFVTGKREQTAGEVYHAVSDCINQDALVEFLGKAVDVPRIRVPVPYQLYRGLSTYAVIHSRRIERIARERDKRPKIDAPITQYLSKNMWFSNEKIRDLGFEFTYRDPRRGLWQYITWCKEEGLLP